MAVGEEPIVRVCAELSAGEKIEAWHNGRIFHREWVTDLGLFWIMDALTGGRKLLDMAEFEIVRVPHGTLTGLGTSAHLLRPEPNPRINDGTPPGTPHETPGRRNEPSLDVLWKQALDSLDAAIAAAKEDPAVAKQLSDFARYGCRSEESVRGLRETFAELQIPLTHLSHTDDQRPFA